jgi:hypothetical protein
MSNDFVAGPSVGRAMALNPAAGTHPVTADPRELSAAKRAGERSLQEYPYYLERYGERARLFGLSDGAWIVTLCENPDQNAIEGEIAWLAHVLSSRGMPSIMMERHLDIMAEELTEAVPAKAEKWERLRSAREAMATKRREVLPEADMLALADSFTAAADPEVNRRLPRMGELLVCAAIDEARGISRAAISIEEWARSADKLPAGLRAGVERTLADARKKVVEAKTR